MRASTLQKTLGRRLRTWNRTVDAIGWAAPILEWFERTMAGLSIGRERADHLFRAGRWREKWQGWRLGSLPRTLDPRVKICRGVRIR
jgi:hypothetical protein